MNSIVLLKSHLSRMGGAEKYTLRLALAFKDKGCDVTILTCGPIPSHHINIVSMKSVPKLSFQAVIEFDKWCEKMVAALKPAIVFGLDRNKNQTHIRASNGVHAAFLENRAREEGFLKGLTLKINPLHLTILKIEKEGFENTNLKKLFVNSHMVKSEILRFYQVDPKKIEVIHNGVEWEEWQEDFDSWEQIKKEGSFQFLFIGHNYKRKGLEKVLRDLSLMKEKEFHLNVVGKEKNINYFINLAKKLGLEKKTTFFGPQANIKRFYQISDCLVLPSSYDPFANVTVEALAMGLFVVTSKSNGAHEILTQTSGTTGSLDIALNHPKTKASALAIRNSVKHLDFSTQLQCYLTSSLE